MPKSIVQDHALRLAKTGVFLFIEMKKQKEFVISNQFLKSVTSIGANINEALAAESRKDFIHKLSISLKEARETEYWIKLLSETNLVSINTEQIIEELDSTIAMLVTIINTSRKNSEP